MGLFGKKKNEGGLETEYGGDMVGMMKMIAGMPGMMRKPMMKGRLSQLLELPEEKRQESIREMMRAFHSPKIKDSAREKLITTRVEIVGEFPENQRQTIMKSRTAALRVAPELEDADKKVQQKILPQVSEAARTAFVSTMEQMKKDMAAN